MAIGDLGATELATLTARVQRRIVANDSGILAVSDATATEIAQAAVEFIVDVAPRAPDAIGREAATRLAGWLLDSRPHLTELEITDPSGTMIKQRFTNTAATGNGFRASGASSLVSRYIVRRAGVVA